MRGADIGPGSRAKRLARMMRQLPRANNKQASLAAPFVTIRLGGYPARARETLMNDGDRL
jgi:hypothetical protein